MVAYHSEKKPSEKRKHVKYKAAMERRMQAAVKVSEDKVLKYF